MLKTLSPLAGDADTCLSFLGWADRYATLKEAIQAFQNAFGLEVSGVWDQQTIDHVLSRQCPCPDFASEANTSKGHWDADKLRLWNDGNAFFKDQRLGDVLLYSAKLWSRICGLEFVAVDNQRDSDIWARYLRIDGPGRTLAWAFLPRAHEQPGRWKSEQRYDSGDANFYRNMASRIQVMVHELGHSLGLPHVGQRDSVMYPAILKGWTDFGNWERSEMVGRYGPPADDPDPDTPFVWPSVLDLTDPSTKRTARYELAN